ncbi:helix-turn-helix domain-containing protein [Phenylobacterium sp. LjRoot219]|uniref:helix-turn-helix domain-containing protein n=1 Tax=Phenylobacterium sp. LjRoot219 TaxID=3342283 RepID=UPI003ED12A5F
MSSPHWIAAQSFAEAAGITPQAARAVLRGAQSGKLWRGRRLVVQRCLGRGGKGGLNHRVEVTSLPDGVRARLQECLLPASSPAPQSAALDERTLTKLSAVEAVVAHPPGSRARGLAADQAARAHRVTARTIYRWLARYERHGLRGLGRSRPSNRGKRRVRISRDFDRAYLTTGLPEAGLEKIATQVDQAMKGLWASRAEQAGGAEVRRLAEFILVETCEQRGLELPASAMRLSRRRVERFAHYRAVNQRRNDRKAYDDAKPRIRRNWTGLAPMERVVADVKHLDVIVQRPDGSTAWPKIIAFMDAGTGRVFVHPVLLDRGEGVRQEHVIEAFLAMVADPAWGFPQGLYLDNGAEFAAMAKIDGALQLLNAPGTRTTIFARPYNAAAKPIESLFARLDRYVFALLPGYAGPNRLAKKTQALGKPPQPYPGEWDDFRLTVLELVRAHNHRPVGGLWAGRSPAAWFEEKVQAGWRPVSVEACTLDAAFADTDSRRIDRGVLKINGRRFTHEALVALPSRTVVDLALPWRRDAPPLARLGGAWVYLQPDAPYPARWIEGARESGRRQARLNRHVSALAKDAPKIDPVDTKLRWARRIEPLAVRTPLPSLDLGGEVSDRGRAMQSTAVAPPPSHAAARRLHEMALTARLEAQQADD